MKLRMLARCGLLMAAFALTTFALAQWQVAGFSVEDIWPFAEAARLHPLHMLIVGIALIPPALWEIFLLDHATSERRD